MDGKVFLNKVLAFIVLSITSVSLFASENIEVNTFKEVEKKVLELGKKYGPENVLIGLDIDCTLITNADNFGSDVWWDWQSTLLKNNPESPYLVSRDFSKLLFYQGIIQQLTVGDYSTEKDIPAIIKDLQNKGFNTIVITARGPETLNRTEAQIENCQLNFSGNKLLSDIAGKYAPYELNVPEKDGITQEDVTNFKLKIPRKVRFDGGVLYCSGQNKGILLKALLFKQNKKVSAIAFVDDQNKNTDDVWNVYKGSNIDVNCYRYSFDDGIKRQFKMSDKNNVIKQWIEFNKAITDIFGKPLNSKDNY